MKAQRLPLVLGEDAVENQRVEVDIQIEPAAKTLKRYGEDWGGSEQRTLPTGCRARRASARASTGASDASDRAPIATGRAAL